MSELTLKDIRKDIFLMVHKAEQMLELTEDAFMKNKVAALDQASELAREVHGKEDAVTAALAKLATSGGDARIILSVPAHVEKIVTSIERIMDNVRVKIKEGLLYSDKAIQETSSMIAKGKDVLKKAGEAMVTGTPSLISAVKSESDFIVQMANKFATAHEDRLVSGECSPKSSSTYLCLLYAFEDLAAHTKDALRKLSGA